MPDLGNTSVFSQTDANNNSGTMPSWSGSAAPSTIDDAGRAFQGAVFREWNWRNPTLTTTGSANAYVLTYSVAPAAYYNGQTFSFKTNFAVTGSATLNVNSLGAKTIKKDVSGTLTALSSGDIASGAFITVSYNSSDDSFVWMNRTGPTYTSATEGAEGLVELATTGEAETGTDMARAVTPAGLLAAISGQHTIWVPATAMISRTTNGAASGTVETSTNKVMLKTLDFDTTTQEFAQFQIQMPKSWNEGTIVAQFVWSHPSTTTNFGVVWALEAVAFADDDAADTAFGTAVTATDTGGTTNDIYISPETSAMTVAGSPAAEEWVVFQVKRNVSDGSDTLAVDARLHGVKIHYTTNAFTDD